MRERSTSSLARLVGLIIAGLATVSAGSTMAADPPAVEPAKPAVAPVVRLCAGPDGTRGVRIARAAIGAPAVRVEPVVDAGAAASLDALRDGKCDAAIVHDDAYALRQLETPEIAPPQRVASLYTEHVHLLCDAAVTADRLSAAPAAPVTVYIDGPVARSTWSLFTRLVPALAAVTTEDAPAATAIEKLASGGGPGCVLMVGGFGGGALATANEKHGAALRLVQVVDRGLHKPLGTARRQIYAPSTITARTWPGLLEGDLVTQTVDVVLLVSPTWLTAHPGAVAPLGMAVRGAVGETP